MSEDSGKKMIIVSCPGGSNVSLMSYKAAGILQKEGYGKFVRLAGDKFKEKDQKRLSEAAQDADQWLLIDGCTKACGKAALDSAGIKADHYVVVTDLGIEREMKMDFTDEELDKVLTEAKRVIG